MKDHILQNAINIIRNLQEEGMVVGGGAPTNNISSGQVKLFDPVMKLDGRSKVMRRLPPPYRKDLLSKKKG
jgi:chaperonin GroEL (HSP60 family)